MPTSQAVNFQRYCYTITFTSSFQIKLPPPVTKVGLIKPRLRCTLQVNKRPVRGPTSEEKNFLTTVHTFMRERRTPISKIPVVGFKEGK